MRPSTLERAFELAKSGECRSFTEVARRLVSEGFSDARSQLDGQSIRKQISALLTEAAARRAD